MNAHLPHMVRFPGGYVVTIKTLAPSTLRKMAKGDCYGFWDGGSRTIFVDKTASELKQRYVLSHEMQHALADWQHFYLHEDQA